MNKVIESEIQKILKERKHEAEKIASQNLSRARENLEFLELEKQANLLKIEIAQKAINNENSENLIKKLEKIEKNIEILLKNLKINTLEPNYHCKKCNDSGVCNNQFCSCRKSILSEILLKKSGINLKNLPKFEDAEYDDKTKVFYQKLREWSEKFPEVKNKNLFVTGQVGIGKTFLCSCIANKLIERGFFVFYTSAFSMNKNFLDFCKTNNEEILNQFLSCDVLIIDDFGSEPILNNITLNYFYTVINERLIKNKSTIINSNLMPDEILERYGERIFSRIMNKRESLIINFVGEDKRLKK